MTSSSRSGSSCRPGQRRRPIRILQEEQAKYSSICKSQAIEFRDVEMRWEKLQEKPKWLEHIAGNIDEKTRVRRCSDLADSRSESIVTQRVGKIRGQMMEKRSRATERLLCSSPDINVR